MGVELLDYMNIIYTLSDVKQEKRYFQNSKVVSRSVLIFNAKDFQQKLFSELGRNPKNKILNDKDYKLVTSYNTNGKLKDYIFYNNFSQPLPNFYDAEMEEYSKIQKEKSKTMNIVIGSIFGGIIILGVGAIVYQVNKK